MVLTNTAGGDERAPYIVGAKAIERGCLAATTLAQHRIEAERLFWYAHQVDVPISDWGLDEFSEYVDDESLKRALATTLARRPR